MKVDVLSFSEINVTETPEEVPTVIVYKDGIVIACGSFNLTNTVTLQVYICRILTDYTSVIAWILQCMKKIQVCSRFIRKN